MKVFFNALIVHLLFNAYVFLRGWQIVPPKNKWIKVPYTILFIVELLIYLIGFFFWKDLPQDILRPIVLIGTSWMVFIGYLSALLLVYDLILFLNKKVRKKYDYWLQKKQIKKNYFLISLSLVLLIMAYGSYRFYHPVVTNLNLQVNKKVEGLDSLKVVVVSDVHVGTLINKKQLQMYVDRIMEQKPDLILLVGDIIDYDLPPVIEQRMDEEFKQLKAPYGVYGVTGNHEYRLNAEEKIAWLNDKAGLTMLRDSVADINGMLYVVGREDDKFKDRKKIEDIVSKIDTTLPLIVMNHEPHRLAEEVNAGADVAVYGHTHNGQLFPYNIVIGWIYEVGYGYKKKANTHVYVTSGLGLAGPQYRIGTISEILVLNLKFKK